MNKKTEMLEEKASRFTPNEVFLYALATFLEASMSANFVEVYSKVRDLTQLTQAECARKWKITRQGVAAYIKSHDLEKLARTVNVDAVMEAYRISKGDPYEAAKNLPYNIGTFIHYWEKAGFEVKKRTPLSRYEVDWMLEVLKRNNNLIAPTEKQTGHCREVIKRYAKKEGIKIRRERQHRTLTLKHKRFIKRTFLDPEQGDRDYRKTAALLNLSHNTVYGICRYL